MGCVYYGSELTIFINEVPVDNIPTGVSDITKL